MTYIATINIDLDNMDAIEDMDDLDLQYLERVMGARENLRSLSFGDRMLAQKFLNEARRELHRRGDDEVPL